MSSFAAKETWSDEIIMFPNGDACLSADGERSVLRVKTEHSSWEDEGNSQGTSMREACSKLLSRVCRMCSQGTTTVRIQLARVFTHIDDEFEMSRRHEPTVTRMTRQNRETFFHRSLTTSVLAGRDTRTL